MKRILRYVVVILIALMAHGLPAEAGGRHGGGHSGHSGHMHSGHGGGHHHGGGHVSFGVVVGGPGWWGPGWWGPGWWGPYPYPYYPYYAPPVVAQQPTELYMQPAPRAEEQQYWYYCQDPQGYYPYVKKCGKGWLKVIPPTSPPE